MVRELSKHQNASCLIVVFVIARFALLSCHSSAKTRIRPVKFYHRGCGGRGHQPRCQDVFVQEGFSNGHGVGRNHNGEHNAIKEAHQVLDGELHFTDNGYEAAEQGNGQYGYCMGFTSSKWEYKEDLYFEGEANPWPYNGHDEYKGLQDTSFQNDGYQGFKENEPFSTLGF